jgi:protein-tyrosine-phosphatase
MAAGLFYDKMAREGDEGRVRIRSAGTWALENQPASAYARQVMNERDLDIEAHRGRNLTREEVAEANLILVMTQHHATIIARDLGGDPTKIRLLSEMAGPGYDIEDPYGGSLADYRQTAAELADLVERGYPAIMAFLENRTYL